MQFIAISNLKNNHSLLSQSKALKDLKNGLVICNSWCWANTSYFFSSYKVFKNFFEIKNSYLWKLRENKPMSWCHWKGIKKRKLCRYPRWPWRSIHRWQKWKKMREVITIIRNKFISWGLEKEGKGLRTVVVSSSYKSLDIFLQSRNNQFWTEFQARRFKKKQKKDSKLERNEEEKNLMKKGWYEKNVSIKVWEICDYYWIITFDK